MAYLFPFGGELHPLMQEDRTEKKVFVLGVYASAVHARWMKDGKTVWDGTQSEAGEDLERLYLQEFGGEDNE